MFKQRLNNHSQLTKVDVNPCHIPHILFNLWIFFLIQNETCHACGILYPKRNLWKVLFKTKHVELFSSKLKLVLTFIVSSTFIPFPPFVHNICIHNPFCDAVELMLNLKLIVQFNYFLLYNELYFLVVLKYKIVKS